MKLRTKLGENFLRKVICRHATLKRRESEGNQANVSRYKRLTAQCSSIVFLAIDSGVLLIINARPTKPGIPSLEPELLIHVRLRRAPSLSSLT